MVGGCAGGRAGQARRLGRCLGCRLCAPGCLVRQRAPWRGAGRGHEARGWLRRRRGGDDGLGGAADGEACRGHLRQWRRHPQRRLWPGAHRHGDTGGRTGQHRTGWRKGPAQGVVLTGPGDARVPPLLAWRRACAAGTPRAAARRRCRRPLQKHSPRSHTIIEAHPDVYAHMKERGWDKKPGVGGAAGACCCAPWEPAFWAAQRRQPRPAAAGARPADSRRRSLPVQAQVTILFGRWQDVLPQLPRRDFDGIFFDTYGALRLRTAPSEGALCMPHLRATPQRPRGGLVSTPPPPRTTPAAVPPPSPPTPTPPPPNLLPLTSSPPHLLP
jgi:hypothetical protein